MTFFIYRSQKIVANFETFYKLINFPLLNTGTQFWRQKFEFFFFFLIFWIFFFMIQRFFFPGKWATISNCHRMEIFFYRKIVLTSFMLSNKNSTFNKLFAKMNLSPLAKQTLFIQKYAIISVLQSPALHKKFGKELRKQGKSAKSKSL